jgi:hypothetical protein
MTTKPTKVPITTTLPAVAKSPAVVASPEVVTSSWEDYLTGKKVSANHFLAKMAKGAITLPNEETRNRFAEALGAKPERVGRLILLLQASDRFDVTVSRIVIKLVEAGINRLGVVSFPEPLNAVSFRRAISSWLASIKKKPLKPADLNILFLLLHYGHHRQLLEHDTGFSLVASAISKPIKTRPKQAQHAKLVKTSLEVLLAAAPTTQVLSSLLAFSAAHKAAGHKLNAQIQSQEKAIERLTAELSSLNSTINGLRAEIAKIEEQKVVAENRVFELEKQIVDIRDGYQHKIDELRGRIRGMLQGQLTRWLQTALDASRSDPPWTKAIQERLEDSLKLIEKEIQWLQPSA